MELLVAIYTVDIGFYPELVGWWMLWFLRVALIAFPLMAVVGKVKQWLS